MTFAYDDSRRQVEEFLVDQTLFGLDADEERELQAMLDRFDDVDVIAYERTAAAVALSGVSVLEPLPIALRQRIVADAAKHVPSALPPVGRAFAERIALWSGWLVAAAILLFFSLRGPETVTVVVPAEVGWDALSPAEYARRVDERAGDLESFEWSGGEFPQAGASGRIYWSERLQRGYLKVSKAASNQGTQQQYQLWIFSKNQKHPVDGGVFDIPADDDEVLIPVEAKVEAHDVELFAVTVERQGGVVVSDRERIVLTASTH